MYGIVAAESSDDPELIGSGSVYGSGVCGTYGMTTGMLTGAVGIAVGAVMLKSSGCVLADRWRSRGGLLDLLPGVPMEMSLI